jgi:hypothetical protein
MKKLFIILILIGLFTISCNHENNWCHWEGDPIKIYVVKYQNSKDTIKANYFQEVNNTLYFYIDKNKVAYYDLGSRRQPINASVNRIN